MKLRVAVAEICCDIGKSQYLNQLPICSATPKLVPFVGTSSHPILPDRAFVTSIGDISRDWSIISSRYRCGRAAFLSIPFHPFPSGLPPDSDPFSGRYGNPSIPFLELERMTISPNPSIGNLWLRIAPLCGAPVIMTMFDSQIKSGDVEVDPCYGDSLAKWETSIYLADLLSLFC